jgi:hypothetical protein
MADHPLHESYVGGCVLNLRHVDRRVRGDDATRLAGGTRLDDLRTDAARGTARGREAGTEHHRHERAAAGRARPHGFDHAAIVTDAACSVFTPKAEDSNARN